MNTQFKNGIFVENIPENETEESIYTALQKYNITFDQIKIPRKFNQKQSKGILFLAFSDKEKSIQAKKILNFATLFNQVIRVAIIGKKEQNANVLISNVDKNVNGKEFDDFFS